MLKVIYFVVSKEIMLRPNLHLHLHLDKSVKIVRYHINCKNVNKNNAIGY